MATPDWLINLIAEDLAERRAERERQAANEAAINTPGTWQYERAKAAEAAAAEQNQFTRGQTERGTAVNERNADTSRYNSRTDRTYKEALVAQAADDLAFKYHQQSQEFATQQGRLGLDTLSLGASLRGPRDWMAYMDTTAQAGQNPLIQQAVGTWADLTNNRPRGVGAWNGPAPQRFDLNALASDFMGGGGGSGGGQQRVAALDTVARNPGAAAPGWWQSLGPDAQEMAKGYWERTGDSPATILNRLAYTAPNQGLGYGGV